MENIKQKLLILIALLVVLSPLFEKTTFMLLPFILLGLPVVAWHLMKALFVKNKK